MQLNDVKIERSTTVDRVVFALKRAMFDGKILPGEQLKEIVLSSTFSVSRSTIREALRIMTSEGLAVHFPNKGVTVRKLKLEEIEDIFLTRSVLEISAARTIKRCLPCRLKALETAMKNYSAAAQTEDALAIADSHVDFHSAMVGLIGSERLIETERSIMRDLKLVITSIDKNRDDLGREVEKHECLTRLLFEKNENAAIEWITNDLSVAKGFIVKHICN